MCGIPGGPDHYDDLEKEDLVISRKLLVEIISLLKAMRFSLFCNKIESENSYSGRRMSRMIEVLEKIDSRDIVPYISHGNGD